MRNKNWLFVLVFGLFLVVAFLSFGLGVNYGYGLGTWDAASSLIEQLDSVESIVVEFNESAMVDYIYELEQARMREVNARESFDELVG